MGSRDGPNALRAADGRGSHSAALARVAVLLLLGGVLTPLVVGGLRSVLWVLVGVMGLALTAVGVWWVLARTGPVRIVGTAVSVAAPVTVLALYAAADLLGPALLSLVLLVLAVVAARRALAPAPTASNEAATASHRPWVLMNRRSGGGKVDRFNLVDKARDAGCRVHVLDPGQDAGTLARQAVVDGADLLGVAGGDGTQALVADVAAHHDVPFAVIPAGTRNHFALDLGLDRDDPVAALEALTGGVELRVDLGYAADRVFVNNASFGTYASVVNDPAYRDAKARTALRNLPGLLAGENAPALRITANGRHMAGLQALLVSNNPYGRAVDVSHPGRRQRLDTGLLGVACVRVGSTAEAARLASRPHSGGLVRFSADEVSVETGSATMPVGIDGEHVVLPCPVVCRSAPGALRVRVPRRRPGRARSCGPTADWPRVARLALSRPIPVRSSRAQAQTAHRRLPSDRPRREWSRRDGRMSAEAAIGIPERSDGWMGNMVSRQNAPVLGSDGRVALIVHWVEEIAQLIRARRGTGGGAPSSDWYDHTATHSSAGRTPPVLLGPDGVTTFLDLDKATDPPLGARGTRRGRTQGQMRRRDTS